MKDCDGMHKEFKKLLHRAEGQSRRVVVVFLDVRGFSSFAGIAESTDTAEFLKTVYIKILDEHFPDAEFFKPTGDGLLILLDYEEKNLEKVVRGAVDRSIRLVESFGTICDGDEMINFDVPGKLGIGLARGSATSLATGKKVLDFSGRPLNLASRLMDLARPSGIVFDQSFGFNLLEPEVQKLFAKDAAYVKGLAESKPMTVFRLDGYTQIPEHNKRPLDGFIRFTESEETITFKALEERALYRHPLTRDPARTDNIELHIEYPKVTAAGGRHKSMNRIATLPAEYGVTAGSAYALVDYRAKTAEMKAQGLKGNWEVSVTLEYSVVPSGSGGS
ncbi:MAG TPA: adenylate/guanylate cyclase domain-containing protein [Solirubrobacterales bacterium]